MASLGSGKAVVILSICLLLYIILVGLLMFYIEESAVNESDVSNGGNEKLHKDSVTAKCFEIQKIFQKGDSKMNTGRSHNASMEQCVKIISEMTNLKKKQVRKSSCRFNPSNFLPWVHCVTFSLMTIGGSRLPVTTGGKVLLTLATIFGIFPFIRLFVHAGVILSNIVEQLILRFELKVLNRSPRMIHAIFKKLVFVHGLFLVLYNVIIALVTSMPFYETNWTFLNALAFWLQSMLTKAQPIEVADEEKFYSNGGWRILCIDLAMIGNLVLMAGFICAVVSKMHRRICQAAKTIKKSFKRQNPEVYLQIKPLKSHL